MNFTAPEMTPTLACRVIFFLTKALPRGTLIAAVIRKRLDNQGRRGRQGRGWGKKGTISGSKENKLGIISKWTYHFAGCTIIFTFSLHIAISEQRNTRFNGTQPVLLALCLPFTCFDFFTCFSWKLRSGSKGN